MVVCAAYLFLGEGEVEGDHVQFRSKLYSSSSQARCSLVVFNTWTWSQGLVASQSSRSLRGVNYNQSLLVYLDTFLL